MRTEAYVFRSGIWCNKCAESHMHEAWAAASPGSPCPQCGDPLTSAKNARDTGAAKAWDYWTLDALDAAADDDPVCLACRAVAGYPLDNPGSSQDSDDWPQPIFDFNDADDAGECCDACYCEICPPSEGYLAERALESLPEILLTIGRGEGYRANFKPLPDIMAMLADEWSTEEVASHCTDAPITDPEETLLTCIRALATMHPSPRAWLADGNLTRILERL